MSKKTVLCLCLLVSLSLGQVSWAEEGQEEEFPPELSTVEVFDASIGFLDLSLTDCIAVALKNNLDVEIARLDPLIGDKDISVEKAAFDPVLEATGGIAKTEVPINSAFVTGKAPGNLRQDVRDLDTTVSMLTPIGMTVSMQYTFERRFRSTRSGVFFNPAVDTFIEAKLTQPLLKKFGIFYTRSKIYIARNDKKKSLYAFKRTAIQVTNEVQKAYWGLVKAIEDLKVAHKSLQRAQEFMRSNKLQVQAGILAPIDLAVDEEEVALREEDIIIAEDAVRDKEDQLKLLLNFFGPDTAPWLADITIVPGDRPVFEVQDLDLDNSMKVALGNRPEIFEKKLELDNAGIETRRKKNELLPQLDLEGGFNYSGLSNHLYTANDSLFSEEFQGEYAKLTFEVPIGLRKERAEYSKAKYERRKAQLELSKQEQDIVAEVREAVRQVRTEGELVRSTKKTLKAAQDRLDAEEKKYYVGRTTNLEVFRAQESLAIQEARRNKAITDYHIAQGGLEAVKGTILERFNVVLEGQVLRNELIY